MSFGLSRKSILPCPPHLNREGKDVPANSGITRHIFKMSPQDDQRTRKGVDTELDHHRRQGRRMLC